MAFIPISRAAVPYRVSAVGPGLSGPVTAAAPFTALPAAAAGRGVVFEIDGIGRFYSFGFLELIASPAGPTYGSRPVTYGGRAVTYGGV